jgi:hypothetical protein
MTNEELDALQAELALCARLSLARQALAAIKALREENERLEIIQRRIRKQRRQLRDRVAALEEALTDLLHFEIAHVGPYAVQRAADARAVLSRLKEPT